MQLQKIIYYLNKIKFLTLVIYFIFVSGNVALSENQTSETQFYKLKAKLKIKDSFANSYWQERERINWDNEVKKWKFGFLKGEDSLPPMVVFKDNFSPTAAENIFWIHNEATFLVINPLDKAMITRLIFFATPDGKDKTLQVYVNGQFKEKVVISCSMYDERFKQIVIEDILLVPGKNEIIFYGPNKNDIKSSSFEGKINKIKNLSIQIRDDIKFEIKSLNTNSYPILNSEVDYSAEANFLDIFIFHNKDDRLFLMSQNLDIDLMEYPYFDFNYECKNAHKKLDIFLGVDFNNDGKVDGYLNPRILHGVNLIELARNKWANDPRHYYPSFRVKYILAISSDLPEDYDIIEDTNDFFQDYFYMLRITNFRFYSNKSIVVPVGYCSVKDFKLNHCKRKTYKKNTANYFIDKQLLLVSAYFYNNSNNEEEKLIDKYTSHTVEPDELSEECVELSMPITIVASSQKRNTYLAFSYMLQLQDFDRQIIDVFLGLDNDGDGNIDEKKPVPEKEITNLFTEDIFQRKEINLTNFSSDAQAIKQIIFKLHKNNKNIGEGWYSFWIADNIEIYSKYPSSIRDETLRNNFLKELTALNFPLLDIDHQEIKFSQINNKAWDIFEDKEANLGNIKLPSGKHTINLLENDTFKTEWIYLEAPPEDTVSEPFISSPEIVFKKINQTKYIVQVKGAREPFWLFFNESFHPQWKVFLTNGSEIERWEVIKNYENLGVKEARYKLNYSPWDLKYLFAKPLAAEHFFANFYANSWCIDPKKLNLSKDFTLVLYFWPQFLFNIGLTIAGFTFILCILYLILHRFISENNQ